MLGDSPISWKTKKQKIVSHSSVEAEYRSMAAALREVKWLRKLLKGLDVKQHATRFYCDSKSAIHIASNAVFHDVQNTLRMIVMLSMIRFKKV